jgi:hypothetical protein
MYTEDECTEAVRLLLGGTGEYRHGKVGAHTPTPTPKMTAAQLWSAMHGGRVGATKGLSRACDWSWFRFGADKPALGQIQGCLAHEKTPPPRTLH